jgi:hypothetical protein
MRTSAGIIYFACAAILAAIAWNRYDEARVERALETFAFVYEDGWGTRVDSRAGTVTRDMVGNPDTTVALQLSPAEMRSLYRTFRRVHLLDVREPRPVMPPTHQMTTLRTWWRLDVRMDGREKHFFRDDLAVFDRPLPAQWQALFTSLDSIGAIVQRRPEWKRLPRPRGWRA